MPDEAESEVEATLAYLARRAEALATEEEELEAYYRHISQS